ncbi:MAG: shikimate dehydrogenase [Sarcina sp.]
MKVFGLIGEKLGHSLSPNIHEDLYGYLSMDAKYNLFPIDRENIQNAVESLKVLGIKGANVTIPYKEVIMKQLDYISDEAKKIGAINTILVKNNKTYGYNTDYYGFKSLLDKDNVVIKNNEFYVLGSGGGAKAIVQCLLDFGASKVVIVSRDKLSAQEKFIGKRLEFMTYEDLTFIKDSYAVVNTTPCGMYPKIDTTPIDKKILSKFGLAIDIVYNPEETKFLKEARLEGLKIVKGLYMLVAQAMKSEEIWNDISISREIENNIFEKLAVKFR